MRAAIYNAMIARMTASWYEAVIARLDAGATLLDIGVGTGRALLANGGPLTAKDISVTGIDIDASYVEACKRGIRKAGIEGRVSASLESVYDHRGGPYDAAYFGASFMLLPEPTAALHHVRSLLRPQGAMYFTQTIEHRRSAAMESMKPRLRYLTSIDFGQVTYEEDLLRTFADAGVDVIENTVLEQRRKRSYKLFVAR